MLKKKSLEIMYEICLPFIFVPQNLHLSIPGLDLTALNFGDLCNLLLFTSGNNLTGLTVENVTKLTFV